MNILLVSYYFPPMGGAGVQRALKFSKYLGEFGVRATVLAAKIRAMQRLLTMQRRLVTVTEELYEANRQLNSLIERDAL